jgi:immune inhibitor A
MPHPRCLRSLLVVFIVALSLANPPLLRAVPADSRPFELKQPDGTVITARARGDEWFGWYETLAGQPIVLDPGTGYWVYAVPKTAANKLTGKQRVGLDKPSVAAWEPQPEPDQQQTILSQRASAATLAARSTGTGLIPVILGNFSDTTPIIAVGTISNMLFSTAPGIRSMATYFSEVSYGKFTVAPGSSGVRGWFNVPNSQAYYGATNGAANDIRAPQFVRDVVLAAIAAGYNFAPYDQDGDGKVDVVNIVHTGRGQENGGGPNAIWSHRWSLSAAGLATVTAPGGVVIDDYVIQPELASDGGAITVGVFVHEHGHALGLPDLYDGDYSSRGVGNWSGMSFGANLSTVRPGDCPSHFDPWCKAKLGWLAPINYTLNYQNVQFPYAASNAFAARLWKDGIAGKQYFLVENRFRAGFDSALDADGLVIWHIDESKTGNRSEWYPISPGGTPANTNNGNYLVRVVQADNLFQLDITNKTGAVSVRQNDGDGGDPFPGTSNNRLFAPSTSPNSFAYNAGATPGADSFVIVSNISNAGQTMTADIYTRSPNSGPFVEWVNIAGSAPPYSGAQFSKLDATHPVAIRALPGVSGAPLNLVQLFINRSTDGLWWDFDTRQWTTNVLSRNFTPTGYQQSGFTVAFQTDLPTGTNLVNGTHSFIVRVINSSSIVTEIQMAMTAARAPEVELNLADNSVVNTLTNFQAYATEDSGIGVQRVEIALYYDTEASEGGEPLRWYWDGYNWTLTPLWLGADFPTHPAAATLYYPIGPDAPNLQPNHQYFVSARAVDAFGSAATNTVSVFYDSGPLATIYWRYPASGNWFDAANWNPARVPLNTDHVVVNAPGDYTVTVNGHADCATLRFGRVVGLDAQRFYIPAGTSFAQSAAGAGQTNKFFANATVEQGGNFSAAHIHFSSGADWLWTNGVASGQIHVRAGAALALAGSANKLLGGGSMLRNEGTITWTGTGDFGGPIGARVENLGLFDVRNDQAFFDSEYYDWGRPVFVNAGLFRKSAGTGATRFLPDNQGTLFTNTGVIEIQSGKLSLRSATELGAGGVLSGAGLPSQDGGTVTIFGTNTIAAGATFQLSTATMNGTGAFAGPGTLQWTNGSSHSAALTILPNSTLRLAASTSSEINGGSLLNLGLVTQQGIGTFNGRNGCLIRNFGTWALGDNTSFLDAEYYDWISPVFENHGTLQKTTGTGAITFAGDNQGFVLTNIGLVQIDAGALRLRSSTKLGPGGIFSGAGMTSQEVADITFFGTNTISSGAMFQVGSAVMLGTGAIAGPGTLQWTNNSSLSGTLTIRANGLLRLASLNYSEINGGALINFGTTEHQGAGSFNGRNGCLIRNFGSWVLRSDAPYLDVEYYDWISPLFENHGTLFKDVGGTNVFRPENQGFQLFNAGLVHAQSGVLAFNGGGAHTNGEFRVNAAATLEMAGGQHTLRDGSHFNVSGLARVSGATLAQFDTMNTVAAGGNFELASGTIGGRGSIGGAGTVTWSGGTFAGTNTLLAGGTLNISGNATKAIAANSWLINDGTMRWTGDGDIVAPINAVLRNHGLFEARNDRSFVDSEYYDWGNPRFENLGTFRKTASPGTTRFASDNQGFPFLNFGVLDIPMGTVRFESSFTPDSASTVRITLGGPTPGTNFGRIIHSGTMNFAGQLQVVLTNDFAPTNGTFAVATYAARNGTFASALLPSLSGENEWRTDYSPTALNLRIRATPVCVNITNGLVALWTGDGGTNLLGSGAVTASNGATNSLGLNGGAFQLDGADDYWSVPDSATFRPANVTVEGWVNFNGYGGLRTFFGKPYGGGNQDSFTVWLDGTSLRAIATTPSGFTPLLESGFTPELGRWYHIAFTFDDTNNVQTLYLDGTPVATSAANESLVYDSRPFIIGADIENGSYAFFHQGQIDEVALYNRALAGEEIAALYAAEAAGHCSSSFTSNAVWLTSPSWSNGVFRVTITAPAPAARVVVEMSSDLQNWSPLRTNAPFTGALLFEDPAAPLKRFYRARLEP